MKTDLPDVNVLVALFAPDHQFHSRAHQWLETTERFATTPITETGFIRVAMTARPGTPGISSQDAIDRLRELRALDRATFWPDATSLTDRRAITGHLQGPRQVTDTHLLNLAIAQGGRLVTFDQGIAAPLEPKTRKYILELH